MIDKYINATVAFINTQTKQLLEKLVEKVKIYEVVRK